MGPGLRQGSVFLSSRGTDGLGLFVVITFLDS